MGSSPARMAFYSALAATLVAVVALSGCKKPRKFVRTKAQQERVDQAISKTAPTPKYTVGANFGDKVKLVGLDITPANPKPGSKVVVDFWWEVLNPIEDEGDWKIFVHVEGPTSEGRPARVIADHYAVEDGPGGAGLYPPKEWKKGEFIKDSKTIDLVDPRGQKVGPGAVKVHVGIFDAEAWDKRQENIRLEVKNGNEVKHGDNRVEAATFMVGNVTPAKPFKAPTLQVRKAVAPITLDGKLDEPTWRAAVTTPPLARPDGKALSAPMRTQVRALWDDEAIYFGFVVTDKAPNSQYTKRDQELWKEDVVEVYLDPGADGKDYVELQVSPKNVVFDALFTSHRKPEWQKARSWNMDGMSTAVHTGALAGSRAQGWSVEIRIPWADLAKAGGAKPAVGTRWKANFFRIDHPGGFSAMASWSSVSDDARADFHNLDRAGFLVFAETPDALKARILQAPTPKPETGAATEPSKEAAPQMAPKVEAAEKADDSAAGQAEEEAADGTEMPAAGTGKGGGGIGTGGFGKGAAPTQKAGEGAPTPSGVVPIPTPAQPTEQPTGTN